MRHRWLLVPLAAVGFACGGEGVTPTQEPDPGPVVEPLPEVIGATEVDDVNPDPSIIEFELYAHYSQFEHEPGFLTDVMAYNSSVPGPLIHGRVGDRVIVHFYNQLAEPTTVHWHGLRIDDEMDGNPRIMDPVQPGESFTYDFILPDAGSYWYHPHANTIEQIDRGLQGSIIIRAEDEPGFSSERLIVLDDARFDGSYQMAPFLTSGMDIVHGRAGNTLLTNGSTQPLSGTIASGAIERWRLVNTANMRTMSMSLEGAVWRVIGTDGGLLPSPYETDRIELAVGHRFDVEVRVDAAPGSTIELFSNVLTLDENDEFIEVAIPVASYTVEGEVVADEPVYPAVVLPEIPADALAQTLSFGGFNDGGQVVFTINGKPGDELEDLVFSEGVPVRMELVNEIGPWHPFHLHGQFFQVLTRNGAPVSEPGLKDTVLLNGMERVEILTWFDNPGEWMYHCHIGGHAEYGMMAHMIVNPSE